MFARRKAVSNLSLRTSSGQTPMRMFRRKRRNIQNFVAPPLQTEPASLGFGLVVHFHGCCNLKSAFCGKPIRIATSAAPFRNDRRSNEIAPEIWEKRADTQIRPYDSILGQFLSSVPQGCAKSVSAYVTRCPWALARPLCKHNFLHG